MDILLIALIFYVVGAIFRTVYDFCFKIVEDPTIKFDAKYAATMIISIILSFISAMVTFTLVEIPANGYAFVALAALSQGFAMNHIVNKPVDYLSRIKG